MANTFNTSPESNSDGLKYTHLGVIPPEISSITSLDPIDVNSEHLNSLGSHLANLQEQFPNLASVIIPIRDRIDSLMNSDNLIPNQVIEASNDNYNQLNTV